MAKPTNAPMDFSEQAQSDIVSQAREHVTAAAVILRALSAENGKGDYGKIAWMLEDTLSYLDQAGKETDEQGSDFEAMVEILELSSEVAKEATSGGRN